MNVRVICPRCRRSRRTPELSVPLGVECRACPGSYMDVDPKSLPPVEVSGPVRRGRPGWGAVHPSVRVAGLDQRLFGYLIDAAAAAVAYLPGVAYQVVGGTWDRDTLFALYAVPVLVLLLVQVFLLWSSGQTVGKWLIGTYYAVAPTGEPAGPVRALLFRQAPYYLIPLGAGLAWPYVSWVFAVTVFASLSILFVAADFARMFVSPTRRRVVDYMARTVVGRT